MKQAGYGYINAIRVLAKWMLTQLWDTMNPENRVLIQVKLQDAGKADAVFLQKLMGDEVLLAQELYPGSRQRRKSRRIGRIE